MGSTAAAAERRRRPFLWPFIICLVALLALGGLFATRYLTDADGVVTRDAQVVQSIKREQEVVLLSLGIQGITEKSKEGSSILWGTVPIPWSERTLFVKYNYTAKLGFDGAQVEIEQAGENNYRITIPEFQMIGHEQPHFEIAVEDNGALSWSTPPIEQLEIPNEVLNDSAKDQHITDNEDLLRAQAEVFYNGILRGIDPQITAEYVYR